MTPEQFIMLCVYILAGVLGLCVGSFLNVVIYRVPNEMSLAKPASHCTSCGYTLKWYDNIPVLSYVILRGRCRKCGEHISARYMLVEILNAVLWLLCVLLFWEESIALACLWAVASSVLICIFFIDLEHMLIFNRFLIVLCALGVGMMFTDRYTRWYDHLIGFAVGLIAFLGIYYAAIGILKKEGMGFGDVKLAAVAGLLLGWQRFILAILVASVVASVVLLALRRARGDERDHEYPFGPFFAAGILFAAYVGEPVITWYVGLLIGQ